MAVKKFVPTSPGRRFMTVRTFDEITATKPEKSLLEPLKKKAGRNAQGRITVRHQGGGHKREYRLSILNAIKTVCPQLLPRSSMILIALRILHYFIMLMEKNVIFWLRWELQSVHR